MVLYYCRDLFKILSNAQDLQRKSLLKRRSVIAREIEGDLVELKNKLQEAIRMFTVC